MLEFSLRLMQSLGDKHVHIILVLICQYYLVFPLIEVMASQEIFYGENISINQTALAFPE